jgi:hypothetical protein
MKGGVDAGRDTEPDLERQGRQGDGECRRNTLHHQVDGGTAIAHRLAEVAGEGVSDVGEVLFPDRPFEAPGLAEGLDRLGRRVDRHDEQGGIARQPQHDEGERHDEQDGERSAQQAGGGE